MSCEHGHMKGERTLDYLPPKVTEITKLPVGCAKCPHRKPGWSRVWTTRNSAPTSTASDSRWTTRRCRSRTSGSASAVCLCLSSRAWWGFRYTMPHCRRSHRAGSGHLRRANPFRLPRCPRPRNRPSSSPYKPRPSGRRTCSCSSSPWRCRKRRRLVWTARSLESRERIRKTGTGWLETGIWSGGGNRASEWKPLGRNPFGIGLHSVGRCWGREFPKS